MSSFMLYRIKIGLAIIGLDDKDKDKDFNTNIAGMSELPYEDDSKSSDESHESWSLSTGTKFWKEIDYV